RAATRCLRLCLRLPPEPTPSPYTTLFRSFLPRLRRGCRLGGTNLVSRLARRNPQPGGAVSGALAPNLPPVFFSQLDSGSPAPRGERKSTRLNSSHVKTSYAVVRSKKKNRT